MNKYIRLVVITMAIISMISASPEGRAPGKGTKGTSKKIENVMRIKEVEIKGEVKKPQAVFFIPRSKFTMEDMIVTESFIDNIINVVDKE